MHEPSPMTDMTAQSTLEALSRALDLFRYERGLGLSTIEELLADRQLSPNDRQWLDAFSKLWHLTQSVDTSASNLAAAAGLPFRIECELIDYKHVSPYCVYVGQGPTPASEFKDYYGANYFARAQSAGKWVAASIRDGSGVLFWEIRLTDGNSKDGPP